MSNSHTEEVADLAILVFYVYDLINLVVTRRLLSLRVLLSKFELKIWKKPNSIMSVAKAWEELTITTTQIVKDYPYAIPVGKLLIGLYDTIPPGIPDKDEVKEKRAKSSYSKLSNLVWPLAKSAPRILQTARPGLDSRRVP